MPQEECKKPTEVGTAELRILIETSDNLLKMKLREMATANELGVELAEAEAGIDAIILTLKNRLGAEECACLAETDDRGEVSDGYHTFNELYEHRFLLFINFLRANRQNAFKTLLNDAGEAWDGHFIAGLQMLNGQITYHLPIRLWEMLDVEVIERNTGYDGHNSNDVLERLVSMAGLDPLPDMEFQRANGLQDQLDIAKKVTEADAETMNGMQERIKTLEDGSIIDAEELSTLRKKMAVIDQISDEATDTANANDTDNDADAKPVPAKKSTKKPGKKK